MILENSTRQGKLQNDDERLNELNFCIERGRKICLPSYREVRVGVVEILLYCGRYLYNIYPFFIFIRQDI